jgi:vancomycin resistance protein YoaR
VLRRARTAIVVILVVAVGGTAGVVAVRDAAYANDALPGVSVREVDTGQDVLVSVGDKQLPGGGGVLAVDVPATRAAALAAGRDSVWTRVRRLVDPSPPELVVDPVLKPTAAADELVAELERRAKLARPAAAQIAMRGRTPRVTPGRPGRTIDRDAFFSVLSRAMVGGAANVEAPLAASRPDLDTAAAEEAAETARQLASAPVTLSFDGETVGALAPSRLARLLHFAPRRNHFVVSFDRERLAKAVRPALRPWRKRARNARFLVGAKSVRIAPSRPGLDVNAKVALARVTAAAYSDQRVAELSLQETRPDLTTREADELGIRQQISTFTTDMGVSSSNRIHNVQLMAEYIDGTLLRPGETFSFNESVGPRTSERGFLEGQMIIGSLLLPSIGGGVCQTATTLFNNAWELGLPIVERHNHSFYISHYPMGRDATVSWGGPDFAFKNDLKTGILIKTSYTDATLTFSFWGTKPNRKVVSVTGPQSNWRSPETTYALDPYAPRGSVRTVSGSNQQGFDVTVSRTVRQNGKVVRSDSVTSNYIAVGPTAIYGPGRTIPGSYFVLPRV